MCLFANPIFLVRFLTILLLLAPTTSRAQSAGTTQPEPCAGPPFHQFDFVLGRFELFDDSGKKIADERLESEMFGCVVHEYYRATNGIAADSYTFYDPVEKAWFQYAVGLHMIFRVKGGLESGAMILEGTATHIRTSNVRPLRIVWTPLPDGSIREQLFERQEGSLDWKTTFSGKLVRLRS